jgi:hypothetical protein
LKTIRVFHCYNNNRNHESCKSSIYHIRPFRKVFYPFQNIVCANLFFESLFVVNDVANDLRVEEDDGEHGHEVGEDENEKDEHFRLHGVGEVVERATGQVALWRTVGKTLLQLRAWTKTTHSPGTNRPQ